MQLWSFHICSQFMFDILLVAVVVNLYIFEIEYPLNFTASS